MPKVRVRFAPSPTGFIHVGNARTALFNFLFARKTKGEFIVRIEDTDKDRNKEESLDQILEDLHWLKMEWDEGPNTGGRFGPYRQSLRTKVYIDQVHKLIEKGMVYPCYCTVEELETRRQVALSSGQAPRYDNRCRELTRTQKNNFEREGRKPAWRFKIEPEKIIIHDIVRGEVTFDTGLMGDFVVMKPDMTPIFHLAVTVDDALMEISHVIRGEDHLPNTPRHILLFKAMGYPVPEFAHVSLVQGKDNKSLSKRELTDFFSISGLRDRGYLPEAVVNYLANLGSPVEEDREIMSFEEIIDNFELEKTGSSIATFDYDKLNWYGGHYIRSADLTRITDLTLQYLKEAKLLGGNLDEDEYKYLSNVIDVIRDNVSCLSHIVEYATIFFQPKISLSDDIKQILHEEKRITVLQTVLAVLQGSGERLTHESFPLFCTRVFELSAARGKIFYQTLRYALTGKDHGPELQDIMCLLGNEKIATRIKDVLESNV